MELRKRLQRLYLDGDIFYNGSLVYEAPGIRKLQEKVLSLILGQYENDTAIFSLGYNYGYASFVDCMVGKSRCESEPVLIDAPFAKTCLCVLLCDYLEIYVLGEHLYRDNGYLSPHFDSVDSFKSVCVSNLAEEVTQLLNGSGYQRVYSKDLGEPIPSEIKIESNLGKGLVFDGFFNWTD